MLQIPLQAAPSQRLSVVLNNQNCQIFIYQKSTGLYVDLNVNGVDVSIAAFAQDSVNLNSCIYGPFVGYLFLVDTQGNSDPDYTGLGTRFQLVYMTEADFAVFQQ